MILPTDASPPESFADGKILLTVQQGVAVIRFNHPEKHNAMSVEMWEGLAFALTAARDHPDTRVLILAGEGGKAFVSGADISQFERNQSTPEERAEFGRRAGAYRGLLANFPKPTISCIQGYCIGGGLGLALGTDIRIASSGSQFGIPAAKLSIAYPFSGLQALNSLVGPSWARLLLYSAMRIDAAEAERIGLITRRVADDDLWPHTLDLAQRIASNAPLSVYAAKITIDQILKDPTERDMAAIRAIAARCANSEDAQEGRRAFMEKRAPQFQGR
jgi:enoyl-CoA hydratase/carnithine racemase